MSKRHLNFPSPSGLPLAPIVITAAGISAGFAISDRKGFRFVAGHRQFDLLDGSHFRRIEDIRSAATRLAQAIAEINPGQKYAAPGQDWLNAK